MEKATLTPEAVGYWFFRLNGCLTITNFVLHPGRRGPQRTDADVLAVRFPYRSEQAETGNPLVDHPAFDSGVLTDVIIAEIKTGRCRLNGPWTDPDRRNIQHVLHAIGIVSPRQIDAAASALYGSQIFSTDSYRIRLFALGAEQDQGLGKDVVQIVWPEVLGFILQRFRFHEDSKRDHPQWDDAGQQLWKLAMTIGEDKYVASIISGFNARG